MVVLCYLRFHLASRLAHIARARSQDPQSYNFKEMNSFNNFSELRSRFFPNYASKGKCSPADTLITASETLSRGPS